MKYTGSTDGAAKGKRPGTEKFVQLMVKRWGFTNLGTWAVRTMRGSNRLSVHATGRAADLGWKNPATAAEVANWLVANYKHLGIEEVHDYAGTTKTSCKKWGRGWRCNRDGVPGWKDWTATANGGTPGGKWLHVELTPEMADNPELFAERWKTCVKPEPTTLKPLPPKA
jgi:hypothetical protein